MGKEFIGYIFYSMLMSKVYIFVMLELFLFGFELV